MVVKQLPARGRPAKWRQRQRKTVHCRDVAGMLRLLLLMRRRLAVLARRRHLLTTYWLIASSCATKRSVGLARGEKWLLYTSTTLDSLDILCCAKKVLWHIRIKRLFHLLHLLNTDNTIISSPTPSPIFFPLHLLPVLVKCIDCSQRLLHHQHHHQQQPLSTPTSNQSSLTE